jgi:hypothetical protein
VAIAKEEKVAREVDLDLMGLHKSVKEGKELQRKGQLFLFLYKNNSFFFEM